MNKQQTDLLKQLKENNLYTILGLDTTSTNEDIRKAYKQKVKQYHPDKHVNDISEITNNDNINYEDEFKKIQNAYDILSNEISRKEYDTQREAQIASIILYLKGDLFRMLGNAFSSSSRR